MSEDNLAKPTPWSDGYYKHSGMNNMAFYVKKNDVTMVSLSGTSDDEDNPDRKGTWTHGDFGEAHANIIKEIGQTNYNIEQVAWGGRIVTKAVLSADGKKIYGIGHSSEVCVVEWISEEEFVAMGDAGDPADAPSSHYKIQPEYQGKLIWITGPPGAGKSTSGQLLSKMAGYVYYEADAFLHQVNPYIPPDADEPSLATMKQTRLKGVPKERQGEVEHGMKSLMALFAGTEYDPEPLKVLYSAMCRDIATEKRRLGGDWVVAHAITSKSFRDHIREELGPDLVFVILSMSKDEQNERASARHAEHEGIGEFLAKTYDLFEPACKDEPNTIEVVITHDMSREQVSQSILDMLDKNTHI